jgi:hypothetical protein
VKAEEQPVLVIEDVEDPGVVDRTERAVLEIFRGLPLAGSWTIAIAASDTRGRWDLGVRSPRGKHVVSFVATPAQLPDQASRYVLRALNELRNRP